MTLAFAAVIVGLVFLVWSADKFIEGAAVTAKYFGMSPLLIGMLIIGFGTSAPEMVVSALASMQGNPGIALGNAYGSNITNIALILGLTAVISPILVHSQVLRKEMPILIGVTALAAFQLADGQLSRMDAVVLMVVFFIIMGWSVYQGMGGKTDSMGDEMQGEVDAYDMPLKKALFWLVTGLIILVLSSRLLVWGAVDIAVALGVSDLIIGLTIVAIGTSLPELASSLMAIKKGEHDMAIGNVIGSNLFNTLTVVGIAGLISPMAIDPSVLSRDVAVMSGLTLLLFVFAYGFRGRQGRINRIEGSILLAAFIAYTSYLITTVII
ncbi:calcium/sodium antiporter [Methylophaga sp. OBS3]|uniref:calcium/sodium antiporter n=1 Tax=Methylophaga sp. OBS3 TaxID=2991934 RepID=UPI00224CA756|nr:calcium/sodium antiporter [Methylophaga sp. OBS3]MCX4189041.1 calcium/sodium antiporter [Methylophaga sp. OBS3]